MNAEEIKSFYTNDITRIALLVHSREKSYSDRAIFIHSVDREHAVISYYI